jgi:putative DNA primase/helicase
VIDRSANIPAELRDRPQWVAAHISPSKKRPGKTEKIPVNPTTNQYADSSDPTTWGTLAAALACRQRGQWQGIGFVFSQDDPYCGIDFDDVIDQDGNVEQWALDYVRLLDSYTERSQSGKGLHIIVRAGLPPEGRKKGPVEMYDAGRFFVFTGDVLDGYTAMRDAQAAVDLVHRETFGPPAPPARLLQVTRQPGPLDDARLIDKLRACRGGKYAALWAGRLTGYASQSEADLALCHGLAFYAGGDAATVDRLFRQSGLYREK